MNFFRIRTLGLLQLIFTFSFVNAQDTILVDPGLGTLQAAIDANGGDVVYKLSAGERYGLEQILQVSDATMGGSGKTLSIFGEETETKPPVIQVGIEGDGSTHH